MRADLLGISECEIKKEIPSYKERTYEDLELHFIVEAMAGEDDFIRETAKRILLQPSDDKNKILRRQEAVKDAILHRENTEYLYRYTGELIEEEKKGFWRRFEGGATYAVCRALSNLSVFIEGIDQIRQKRPDSIQSEAFKTFYDRLDQYLSREKKKGMLQILKNLKFSGGEIIHAGFELTGKTIPLKVTPPAPGEKKNVVHLLKSMVNRDSFSFALDERDERMIRNLTLFRNQAEYDLAQVLAGTSDSFLELIKEIHEEAGFFMGVIRLADRLKETECCYPVFSENMKKEKTKIREGRYLPFLLQDRMTVEQSAELDPELVIFTGANQGGKTTFLRMLGQMHLLAQSGLFLPAAEAVLPVVQDVCTHFRQEEDDSLTKGKLAEEMDRFSQLLDHVTPGSLVLFNESFASTNEEEGSQISEEVTEGLLESGVHVYFVTHQYDFAEQMYLKGRGSFLRPSMERTGERLYTMTEAKPEPTSHGMDIFRKIYRAAR